MSSFSECMYVWRDEITVELCDGADGGLRVHKGQAHPANDDTETTPKLQITKL